MIPTIRPISELKDTTGISKLCHETREPVFITKNGHSDLVIMSIETYERSMALMDIYSKLSEAEDQLKEEALTKSHKDIVKSLRRRVSERT